MKTIKIISLLLLTQITGCVYQVANNIEIRKAIYFCGGVNNITEISIHFLSGGRIYCVDGTSTPIHKVKIPKEKQHAT